MKICNLTNVTFMLAAVLSFSMLASCGTSSGSAAAETYPDQTESSSASEAPMQKSAGVQTTTDDAAPMLAAASPDTEASAERNATLYSNSTAVDGTDDIEPFSSYTFTYSDSADNYLVTVKAGEKTSDENIYGDIERSYVITCEDKNFSSQTLEVTAPDGYYASMPFSQESASSVCEIITNDIDPTPLPQLIKFDFRQLEYDESKPFSVSKYCAVSDGKLAEIAITDNASGDPSSLEYTPSDILHTEPAKLMEVPSANVTADGAVINIYTYEYDPAANTLTRNTEPPVRDNILYFGYYYYYKAMDIAYYMYQTTLPVTDYEHYIEEDITDADGNTVPYMYFAIDDPRFSDLDGLKSYMHSIFDEKLADDMLAAAPMRYKDIDGKLYGIMGDGGCYPNLGKLTFTGEDISEDGKTVTFHSRQETRDDYGTFTGYADGGDFVIRQTDSGSYIVEKFRYPYQ